jgi:Calx-beta domain
MLMSLRNDLKTRRSCLTNARRSATSWRPLIEEMEGRQLLSGNPLMVINSTTVQLEGKPTKMYFTVWMTAPSTQAVTVDYNTVNDTAVAGTNYVAKRGILTLDPGQTSKNVAVWVKSDPNPDPILLGVQLSNPTNATILQGYSLGAILPPPPQAQVSINNVEMPRGLSGTETMTFTVSLSTVATSPVTVTATTSNGTAIAGTDYVANSQVLTFPTGQTTEPFNVTIDGTDVPTSQKFFLVTLSNASVPIATSTGAGILDYGA